MFKQKVSFSQNSSSFLQQAELKTTALALEPCNENSLQLFPCMPGKKSPFFVKDKWIKTAENKSKGLFLNILE